MAWTPPTSDSFPSTFKDVLTPDFLKSLYSQIDEQEIQNVGTAEGSAISRGITSSPFEAAAVGAAHRNADIARNSALQGFLYNLAGMKEQENVIGEAQGFQQNVLLPFQGQQNEAERQLRRELHASDIDEQRRRDVFGLYGDIAGGVGQGVGSGVGAYAALAGAG